MKPTNESDFDFGPLSTLVKCQFFAVYVAGRLVGYVFANEEDGPWYVLPMREWEMVSAYPTRREAAVEVWRRDRENRIMTDSDG